MANILKVFKNNNKLKADQVYYDSTTSILEAMWPIGRGFIDFTNTDYSNWLGFTWERELVGLTPVGLNVNDTDFNEIGKTGGEKTHTLTIDEMPSHNHNTVDMCSYTNGLARTNKGKYGYNQIALDKSSYSAYVSLSGGSQAHNNIQPYKVVAYWKRVS